MAFVINESNRETVHTVIAVVLIVSGMAAFFIDLIWINQGEVGTGTLAYIGEAFTLAGALLGILQYVNGRFSQLEKKLNRERDSYDRV